MLHAKNANTPLLILQESLSKFQNCKKYNKRKSDGISIQNRKSRERDVLFIVTVCAGKALKTTKRARQVADKLNALLEIASLRVLLTPCSINDKNCWTMTLTVDFYAVVNNDPFHR